MLKTLQLVTGCAGIVPPTGGTFQSNGAKRVEPSSSGQIGKDLALRTDSKLPSPKV